jgi:hypothetical protein
VVVVRFASSRRRSDVSFIARILRRAVDDGTAGLEHVVEVDGAIGRYGLTEGIFRVDDLEPSRLTMIPFGTALNPIGADDAVPGSDFVPGFGLDATGSADAGHVDGKTI